MTPIRAIAAALPFLWLLGVGCDRLNAADIIPCLEEAYGRDAVVRLDDRNARVFLVWPAERNLDTTGVLAFVHDADTCFRPHPDWAETYSVSLFSARRFAGYKTEPDILPLVKDGTWIPAYLAEFDRGSRTLTFHPARGARTVDVSRRLADW
ncbi:hypothetical protein [uncultured Rhodospira sp.]|uniref:hypothetical protein n=1 Tax=uncultured Rhodospira sp. TaxID=1936189 RepID=UPI002631E2B7|nr:hypothetical protein [uncultured Rhodospira sp.]